MEICSIKLVALKACLLLQTVFTAPADLQKYVSDAIQRQELVALVNDSADEFDVPPMMVWAVLRRETHCQHWDGKGRVKRGGAGEVGIGQILPDGAKIKRKYDLFSLEGNIRCSCEWLGYGYKKCGGNAELTFGWYNAGHACRNKYARAVYADYLQLTTK